MLIILINYVIFNIFEYEISIRNSRYTKHSTGARKEGLGSNN